MRRIDLIELLKKKPGYEVVYLLLRGPQQRQDLANHIGADGGTLARWLETASNEGLVTISADLRTNPQTHVAEKYVEVTLTRSIPDDLIPVIESRGSRGFRTSVPEFTDTGVVHHWDDPHSVESE